MTILEKLRAQKAELETQAALTPEQLWLFQELNYRMDVFECCQKFRSSAPQTIDTKALCQHYKLVNAYVQQLTEERQLGKAADETQQKHRAAALQNLQAVVADYRRRFQSYRPGAPEQYAADIGSALQTVLIAWTQHRNCYTEINTKENAS
jgi:phosphohistidine phosphatase SixA